MFRGAEKGDMYVPGREHKGPTGETMILTRRRALRRCYVSPFSAAWRQHRGEDRKSVV